jgi:hypothetical protein
MRREPTRPGSTTQRPQRDEFVAMLIDRPSPETSALLAAAGIPRPDTEIDPGTPELLISARPARLVETRDRVRAAMADG